MSELSRDPVNNVIYRQIKDPINLLIEQNHLSSAVKLIYSGIDTMAFLGMPSHQLEVSGEDFKKWVNGYLKFEGKEQLTGADVWGARCSMLHNHSVYSRLSRRGECRWIGYVNHMYPPVKFDPTVEKNLVMVSVTALAKSFFSGMDRYLIDLFSNSQKQPIAEQRLNSLVHIFPFNKDSE